MLHSICTDRLLWAVRSAISHKQLGFLSLQRMRQPWPRVSYGVVVTTSAIFMYHRRWRKIMCQLQELVDWSCDVFLPRGWLADTSASSSSSSCTVWVKKSSGVFWHFPQTVGNF